jgi:toxin ParE1/3/4
MNYRVLVQEEAEEDIADIYDYFRKQTARASVERLIERVYSACASLEVFPARGVARDDLAPGLRLLFSVRRVTIAHKVGSE